MAKIDPKSLEIATSQGGIEVKRNLQGMPIAYKGPYLEDWFDEYTECLRENQFALRKKQAKEMGLNEHFMTPEQAKNFEARKKKSQDMRDKALLAGEMVAQSK